MSTSKGGRCAGCTLFFPFVVERHHFLLPGTEPKGRSKQWSTASRHSLLPPSLVLWDRAVVCVGCAASRWLPTPERRDLEERARHVAVHVMVGVEDVAHTNLVRHAAGSPTTPTPKPTGEAWRTNPIARMTPPSGLPGSTTVPPQGGGDRTASRCHGIRGRTPSERHGGRNGASCATNYLFFAATAVQVQA